MNVIVLGGGNEYNDTVRALHSAGVSLSAIYDTESSGVAGELDIPQLSSLSELDKLSDRGIPCDLVLVCWFYKIIEPEIVDRFCILNMHGALLPKYRGFHGNGWAMINGEQEIGYTIHRMDHSLDGGPIVYQKSFPVSDNDTYGEIKSQIVTHFVENIADVMKRYHSGELTEQAQDIQKATFVAKRNLRDCYIEWGQTSKELHDFVRTLTPPVAPGAFTIFKNEKLVILETELFPTDSYRALPGHVVYHLPDRGVLVKTGDGVILVKRVRFKGKEQSALEVFSTVGARLGIDLIGERLKEILE